MIISSIRRASKVARIWRIEEDGNVLSLDGAINATDCFRDLNENCEKLAQTFRVGPTAQKLMSRYAKNMERIEKEAAF